MYRFGAITSTAACEDQPARLNKGESLTLTIAIHEFDCHSIEELYEVYYQIRQELLPAPVFENAVPFSYAASLVEEKHNRQTWYPEYNFYCIGAHDGFFSYWQTGWVGGINTAWPLYADGREAPTRERALATLDFMFSKVQAPSGLFYGISHGDALYGDDFHHVENKDFLLIRKAADALYFSAVLLLNIPARRRATAFGRNA